MTTPKTLVVGSTGHQHVQCVRWKDIQSVNIVDFDLVVINTRPLNEAFLKKCKHDFFENIRISLSRFLKSSGDVIALGDKERWTRISDYTSYSNYSWSPIQIDTHNESGDIINIKILI